MVLIAATASATLWLVLLNRRLYRPGRVETALAQLRFLGHSLGDGEAERMQALFPEGYVSSWALYGLASAQVARALPPGPSGLRAVASPGILGPVPGHQSQPRAVSTQTPSRVIFAA